MNDAERLAQIRQRFELHERAYPSFDPLESDIGWLLARLDAQTHEIGDAHDQINAMIPEINRLTVTEARVERLRFEIQKRADLWGDDGAYGSELLDIVRHT